MRVLVPSGIGPPNRLRVRYAPGQTGLNPSVVTAVTLAVARQDGTTATWTASVLGASTTLIDFAHTFNASDCPASKTGLYLVSPSFATPSGSVPGETFEVFVTAPKGLREGP
jgi:hypothetical protein